MQNGVDLDEVAYYESPHQDLHCFANSAFFVKLSNTVEIKCADMFC